MQMTSFQQHNKPPEAVVASMVELAIGLKIHLTTESMSSASRRRLQKVAQVWHIRRFQWLEPIQQHAQLAKARNRLYAQSLPMKMHAAAIAHQFSARWPVVSTENMCAMNKLCFWACFTLAAQEAL